MSEFKVGYFLFYEGTGYVGMGCQESVRKIEKIDASDEAEARRKAKKWLKEQRKRQDIHFHITSVELKQVLYKLVLKLI